MATIKDVAKEANLSIATVSRVLNSDYPVSEKSRIKVMDAVKKLNYHPNAIARSLKQNKTFMIGVVVPEISNPYFMDLARGIEDVVSSDGYSLIFGSTDEDPKKELKLLKLLNEKRVDAVVLATRNTTAKPINRLISNGLKIFMVDSKIEGVHADVVVTDDWNSTYSLIEHVIKKGHKKICIINGLMTVSTSIQRFDAFKKVLSDYNVALDERYVIDGDFSRSKTYDKVCELLKDCEQDLPTVIFSTNNYMTEGVMLALKEFGLTIPNDISLVSFGDISIPKLIEPKLTIIKQNAYIMGKNMGQLIMRNMDTREYANSFKELVLGLEIRIGDSVINLK